MSIISSYILPHSQILIPEIAQGKEEKAKATIDAIKNVVSRIVTDEPETIIIITSHSNSYENYFHISPGEKAAGNFSEYGVENVCFEVNYDTELVNAISDMCTENGVIGGTEGDEVSDLDHGTTVPLYFLQPSLKKDCKFVRISISGFSLLKHYDFGKCIQAACDKLNRKTVVIASGDLSHRLSENGPFGFSKEAASFDSVLTTAFHNANFLGFFAFENDKVEEAIECILRSATIMAGALNGKSLEEDFLTYESPFGVGFCTCCYKVVNPETGDINEIREFDKILIQQIKSELDKKSVPDDIYVYLTKKAVESYVLNKKTITSDEFKDKLPSEILKKRAGVFVTIKIGNLVRGCMGTFSATKENIAEEIIFNAIDASINDPRFIPIEVEELDSLSYSVDVLGEFEHIIGLNTININKHGLFVSYGEKTGILLPNIEGVKTAKQMLEIVLDKSGIKSEEKYNMYKFKTARHE